MITLFIGSSGAMVLIVLLTLSIQYHSQAYGAGASVVLSRTRPEVIKPFSCSTQLNMKFIMLINVKMPTINLLAG